MAATPRLVASFDDPAGDATGPGTYAPRGDAEFQDGDFDLRRFAVYVDGDDVLLQVTLGAPFRRPEVTLRSGSTPLSLWNGIYLQNVDVYVDTDPAAPGYEACVPGRRVVLRRRAHLEGRGGSRAAAGAGARGSLPGHGVGRRARPLRRGAPDERAHLHRSRPRQTV